MKACDVDSSRWEELASNRGEWRSLVRQKISDFEIRRLTKLDAKRDEIKARPPAVIHYNYVTLTCPLCGRIFINKGGFSSHMRAYDRRQ